MARKKKEIVNITKEDKKTKERYGKDSYGRIIKLEDKGDYKERATKKRIIAVVLWLLAIAMEVIAILRLTDVINWFPKMSDTAFLILFILLDLAFFVPGSI